MLFRCKNCGKKQNRNKRETQDLALRLGFKNVYEYRSVYLCIKCRSLLGSKTAPLVMSMEKVPMKELPMTLSEVIEECPHAKLETLDEIEEVTDSEKTIPNTP